MNQFGIAYIGAVAGFVVGGSVMLVSMSIDPSNVDWAGPFMGLSVIVGACVGGAIGTYDEH